MDLQPVHLVRRAGPAPAAAALPIPGARAELARRWLHGFGPASRADLQWWTGWTAGQVKQALDQLEIAEVDLDGTPGVMLAADEDAPPAAGPWAALLPALDPTAMGWRDRAWYVGEHAPALFDRSGNIGPTAWWDGRIVGGWAHRKDGEIAVRLLEDAGAEASAAIAAEAQRLREWIGADPKNAKTLITPRFRTPLERELAELSAGTDRAPRGQAPEHRAGVRQPPVTARRALRGDAGRRVGQERRQLPAGRRAGPRQQVQDGVEPSRGVRLGQVPRPDAVDEPVRLVRDGPDRRRGLPEIEPGERRADPVAGLPDGRVEVLPARRHRAAGRGSARRGSGRSWRPPG